MIKQFYLTHTSDPNRYYQVRVNLGVMAIKEYFTFPKDLGLKPHYQMVQCVKEWKSSNQGHPTKSTVGHSCTRHANGSRRSRWETHINCPD